jgi:hypothetical protein
LQLDTAFSSVFHAMQRVWESNNEGEFEAARQSLLECHHRHFEGIVNLMLRGREWCARHGLPVSRFPEIFEKAERLLCDMLWFPEWLAIARDLVPPESFGRADRRRWIGRIVPVKYADYSSRSYRVCDELRKLSADAGEDYFNDPVTANDGGDSEGQSGGSEQAHKRGPKRRFNAQKDKEVAESWQRAKGAGTRKKQFAHDRNLSLRKLNQILNRHSKRRRARK